MEHLVLELESLNFQQTNKSENADKYKQLCDKAFYSKQRALTIKTCFSEMCDEQTAQQAPSVSQNSKCVEETDGQDLSSLSTSSEENSLDSLNASEEESEVDAIEAKKGRGGVNFRKMPKRSVKHDCLHSRNLRTSMKPPKTSPKTTEKLRPAQIKKLYTNQKLTNFRPTSLETIFEEPQPMRGGDQFRLVGAKKLRRALICSDGLNTNKAIVNRRRAKIKKNLGRRVSWKKIPLQNFLNYMQSSQNSEIESANDSDNTSVKLETKTAFAMPLKTVNEIESFEMDLADEGENISKTI